ncbi:CLUMA_CG006489, isoform A [Clunio marinus]|uniref:CLUMA_CG006489, isoform A n=1 Tax=Clunio marinus TaxID=568069 RepID=A0A1J1HXZ1_9DIPT|nr:CLUMA_CG006489, isoform A [Clunio marinus]
MLSRKYLLSSFFWFLTDYFENFCQASYEPPGNSVGSNIIASGVGIGGVRADCLDYTGRYVSHGKHFVPPGEDMCKICVCENGSTKGCRVVHCAPPYGCKSFTMGRSQCCDFTCLDDKFALTPTDIAIWLIAIILIGSVLLGLILLAVNCFYGHIFNQVFDQVGSLNAG